MKFLSAILLALAVSLQSLLGVVGNVSYCISKDGRMAVSFACAEPVAAEFDSCCSSATGGETNVAHDAAACEDCLDASLSSDELSKLSVNPERVVVKVSAPELALVGETLSPQALKFATVPSLTAFNETLPADLLHPGILFKTTIALRL